MAKAPRRSTIRLRGSAANLFVAGAAVASQGERALENVTGRAREAVLRVLNSRERVILSPATVEAWETIPVGSQVTFLDAVNSDAIGDRRIFAKNEERTFTGIKMGMFPVFTHPERGERSLMPHFFRNCLVRVTPKEVPRA